MGGKKDRIDSTARKFAAKVKKRFMPARVILFGSRASGTAWAYSDYDFIIVSDAFERMHWLDRISKVVKQWESDRGIDVLPYTAKEFERKQSLLL